MFFQFKQTFLSLALIFVLFVPVIQADQNEADLKEIRDFKLTEKRLDQTVQAVRNMAEMLQKHPELAKEDNSLGSNASINEMVAAYEKIPQLKKSIESAGMTAREFILFQFALFSAAMGDWVVKQGQKLPQEFSAEHVKFYQAHEEKFKALQKEWEAIDKAMKKEDQEEPEEEFEETEE